jgi:hypothetical protein
MLRIILPISAALMLGWFGYWFWGAKDNKAAVEAYLLSQPHWSVTYTTAEQRGFPNRYDVTLTDVVIASKDGKVSLNFPKLQIMRLMYKTNHWIVGFPQTLSITGPFGTATASQTKALASVVIGEQRIKLALDISDFEFVLAQSYTSPSVILSAVFNSTDQVLGARILNKNGEELRLSATGATELDHDLPRLPIQTPITGQAAVFKDGDLIRDYAFPNLTVPLILSETADACQSADQIWIVC